MISRIAVLVAVFALCACGGGGGSTSDQASASPSSSSNAAPLRLAFRKSFLRSCIHAIPGKHGESYCRCTEDRLEATYSDEELARVTPQDPKFQAATHACAAKAGLQVAPGH